MLVMASLRWRCVVSVAWAYGYGHAGVHGTEDDRVAWTRKLTAEGDGAAPLGSVARAEGERHLPPALVGELAEHSALHRFRKFSYLFYEKSPLKARTPNPITIFSYGC